MFKSSEIENIKMIIRLARIKICRPAWIENFISKNSHKMTMEDIF
jgi:hypothetical protein